MRTKSALVVAGLVTALFAALGPIGTASAARAYMSCGFPPIVLYGDEVEGSIDYRRHPEHCYYSDNGAISGLINLIDIHWRNWGKPKAYARAKRVDNHDQDRNGFQRHPVRIVLGSLRPAVGHDGRRKLYYTKLHVIDPTGNSGVLPLFRPGQGPIVLPEYRPSASTSARLPCAVFNTHLGEYGAFVFRLRDRPRTCTEYKGNSPCHCTESLLTRIHWHRWGSNRAIGTATWHYCGMGTCLYRRARLIASRLRDDCQMRTYTRLRMLLPGYWRHGRHFHSIREHFVLPACSSAFQYI